MPRAKKNTIESANIEPENTEAQAQEEAPKKSRKKAPKAAPQEAENAPIVGTVEPEKKGRKKAKKVEPESTEEAPQPEAEKAEEAPKKSRKKGAKSLDSGSHFLSVARPVPPEDFSGEGDDTEDDDTEDDALEPESEEGEPIEDFFFVGPTPKKKNLFDNQTVSMGTRHLFTDPKAIDLLYDYEVKQDAAPALVLENIGGSNPENDGGIVVFLIPYRDDVEPLSPAEFAALKADIAANGVQVPLAVIPLYAYAPKHDQPRFKGSTTARPVGGEIFTLLDGHHRLRAVLELRDEGKLSLDDFEPFDLVEHRISDEETARQTAVKLNLLRRQLTPEKRAELILKYRLEGESLRAIAERVGVSKDTVARELASVSPETLGAGEEGQKITGKNGKKYNAKAEKKRSPKGESGEEEGTSHKLEATTPEEDPDSTAELKECWRCGKVTVLSQGQCAACTDEEQAAHDKWSAENAPEPEPTPETPRDKRQDYCSDPELVGHIEDLARRLTGRAQITLDPCSNAKATTHAVLEFLGGEDDDGLSDSWREICAAGDDLSTALVYVNPPFVDLEKWLEKAIEEHEMQPETDDYGTSQDLEIVVLLPVRTDTDYWQSLVLNYGAQVLFLKGRQTFWLDGKKEESPFRFPCALVYYGTQREVFADWARERGLGAVR